MLEAQLLRTFFALISIMLVQLGWAFLIRTLLLLLLLVHARALSGLVDAKGVFKRQVMICWNHLIAQRALEDCFELLGVLGASV